MTFYNCKSSTSHQPTDQNHWIGCLNCAIEQYSESTDFFREKHLYQPGDEIKMGVSYFTYDPSDHSLSIASTGETVILDDEAKFIQHWLDPARGELKWNEQHQSANWLTRKVAYGVTGSGSTKAGEFTSELTGILVAKARDPDAHPYPVNPSGPAVQYLVDWPWRCRDCGAKAPEHTGACLGCQQKGSP